MVEATREAGRSARAEHRISELCAKANSTSNSMKEPVAGETTITAIITTAVITITELA